MTQFAKVYAGALYDLALEEQLDTPVLEELELLAQAFAESPQYVKLLSSPLVPKEERLQVLNRDFEGKVQPYLLNFLRILCERGEMGQFFNCAGEFRTRYDEQHGITQAVAVTALPLTDVQMEAMKQRLETATGKTVRLKNRVDAAVLGGVRLEMDGKQLDGTVQGRLNELQSRLSNLTM